MSFLLYIDPGSSGLLVQAVIGAVLAVGVFFRSFRQRISGFFGGRRSRKNDTTPPQP